MRTSAPSLFTRYLWCAEINQHSNLAHLYFGRKVECARTLANSTMQHISTKNKTIKRSSNSIKLPFVVQRLERVKCAPRDSTGSPRNARGRRHAIEFYFTTILFCCAACWKGGLGAETLQMQRCEHSQNNGISACARFRRLPAAISCIMLRPSIFRL